MKMRKQASDKLPNLITEQLVGGPFSGFTATYDLSESNPKFGTSYYERVDALGMHFPSKPGRFGVKPFYEFRADVSGSYPGTRTNYPWVPEYVRLVSPGPSLYLSYDGMAALGAMLPTVSEADLSDLASEARTLFVEQMPQQLSIPNFAYEFGEVKGLLGGLTSFLKGFSVENLTSLGKPKSGRKLKVRPGFSAGDVSSSYLAWEFGGAPFIGDLQKLTTLVSTINKRIQALKNSWGKETRLLSIHNDVVPIPFIRDWIVLGSNYPIGPMGSYEIYQRYHKTNVRFTARLTQFLEGLDTLGGYLRVLAAATGFNNPLKIVWETVPFSFAVDWVFNVSRLFDSVTAQPLQGRWDVYDVCYTIIDSSEYSVRVRDIQQGHLYGGTVGSVRLWRKRRGIGFPEFALNLDFSSMSPKQLTLTMALLFGTFRR